MFGSGMVAVTTVPSVLAESVLISMRMHQSKISQLTDKRHYLSDALSTMTSHQQIQNQFGQQFYEYQYTPSTTMNSTDTYEQIEKQSKKRTRRVLSLKERIEVIKIAETRRDTRELALKFDCGRTQILSILSQKERLLREWANNGDPNRLRRRPSVISITTNKVIYEWLYRCKCAQIPLTDVDILQKAYEAKHLFKYSEFRPNRRWLDRFKRKFKIKNDEFTTPDSTFYDGIERSLDLRDIYEDIKLTIGLNTDDEGELPFLEQSMDGNSFENVMNYDQTMSSSNNEICEIEDSDDDEQSWSENQNEYEPKLDRRNETSSNKNADNTDKSITNDQQALACLKQLEEYSMLKDNFRAIGLIEQLEKIYKGELES